MLSTDSKGAFENYGAWQMWTDMVELVDSNSLADGGVLEHAEKSDQNATHQEAGKIYGPVGIHIQVN